LAIQAYCILPHWTCQYSTEDTAQKLLATANRAQLGIEEN